MPYRHLLTALAVGALLLPGFALAGVTADEAKRIDQLFAAYAVPGSPGCALVLSEAGNIVYSKGYGLASIEHGVRIDPASTVMDSASLTKQFTAASILLLAKDKRISLDDRIRKYVPELPPYADPVTIGQLLHHTGGIPDYLMLVWLSGLEFEDVISQDYVLRLLLRQDGLTFPPGSEFSYSNSGYVLLAMVVQRVSGETLREFMQKRIFDPLGMKHTRLVEDHTTVIPNRASSYHHDDKNGFRLGASSIGLVGDGGIFTTAEDLARWAANFGHPVVGGSWLIGQLQTGGRLNDGTPLKYARGMRMDSYRGLPFAAHSGSSAGFNATLMRFPQQRFAAVAMCNIADDSDALLRAVADIHLGPYMSPAAPPDPSGANVDADRYVGNYVNKARGVVHHVASREGKLWYSGLWGDIELVPVGDDRFQMASTPLGTVSFTSVKAGAQHLVLRYDDTVLDMDAIALVAPEPNELRAYAGTYASDQLDTRWTLRVEGNQLVLEDGRRPSTPLSPLSKDVFVSPFGLFIRFDRDASARVTELAVVTDRTEPLSFERTADKGTIKRDGGN